MGHPDDVIAMAAASWPAAMPTHSEGKEKKKKKHRRKGGRKHRFNNSPSAHDRYQPSPILDDREAEDGNGSSRLNRRLYESELARLQVELVKMQ
ncbi:MAG: hypothetical protein ACKO0M_07575, partial [Cyanobium sp.]